MRRMVGFVFVLVGLCAGSALAPWVVPGTVLAQSRRSLGAAQAVARLAVSGQGTGSITVSGTYSGTISFEVIGGPGTAAVAVDCTTPADPTTTVNSTTSTGVWVCPVGGMSILQARMSAYTSGTAVVDLLSAPAGGGGLGAGGGVPTIGEILALFTGTCPSGATCALGSTGVLQTVEPFPGSYRRGTFFAVSPGNPTGSVNQYVPFTLLSNPTANCATTSATYAAAPIGGYLRNFTASLSAANTQRVLKVGANVGCAANATFGLLPGGLAIAPGAVAGGYVDAWSSNQTNWKHANQFEPVSLGYVVQGSTTTGVLSSIGAEFISDDGTTDTWLGFQSNSTLSASANNFLGIGLQQTTTEANAQLPIPFAATLKNLIVHNTITPTNNVVITVRKNGVNTSVTTTITGGDTQGIYRDTANTASFAQGDLLSVNAATGATTQSTIPSAQLLVVPGDSSSAMMWGSFATGTVSTTNTFAQPFSAGTGTTESARQYVSPIACTASNLYVAQASANGGSTVTTFTLRKNEADTALTGTVGVGVTGSVAVNTANTVSIAQGDRISLKYVTNTGTSGTMSAWSLKCS